MKAIYIERHGGLDTLKFGDLLDPVPASSEIVVDIHAASVNAADWKSRKGTNRKLSAFPHVLGRDFSGVVGALGTQVRDFRLGDEVVGVCDPDREGAYAEKIAIDANIVAAKPSNLSHVDAAAAALAGLTALIAIEDTLKLQADESILIQGGAGGVGSLSVQLAKHIGSYVITTASAANVRYCHDLGADEVIDYQAQDFTKVVPSCDTVLDTVGGDVAFKSFDVLKPRGRAAFIASGPEAPIPTRPDVVSLRPKVVRSRRSLDRVMELVEVGTLQVPPIHSYSLSEARLAHQLSEARHFRGKLVLRVR